MSILHVSNEPLLEVTVKEKTLIKQLAENYKIDLKGGRIREKYCEDIIIEHHGMTVADMELRDIIATLKYGIVSKDEEKRKILSDNIGRYANLQLAEYILMLSKALKNNAGIKVSTTIRSIPEKPIFINSSYNLHFLWLYANTMLEKQQKGVYQYTFYWKKKEQMKEEGYEQFKEPYTEEELKTIIKYEKEQKELKNGQKMHISEHIHPL